MMEKKILFAASLLLFGILIFAGSQSAPIVSTAQSAPADPDEIITVLNPAATNTVVPRLPLTSRLSSLDNKIIYLVDIGWGGPEAGYSVLQVISKHLAQSIPTVKTVVVRKKGSFGADDPELWKEIKAKGHAAILGISC